VIELIGDVIFVRSSSLTSWLIRKITHSLYSHCAIVLSDNFLIESDLFRPVKVRKNKYKQFKVVHLNITDKERLDFTSFLLDQTGRQYDYKRIFGIFLYLIGFTKNRNLWNDFNKDICNEFLVRGFTYLNSDNIPKEVLSAITPSDLANVLLKDNVINKQ
jgi:hypothetical protein